MGIRAFLSIMHTLYFIHNLIWNFMWKYSSLLRLHIPLVGDIGIELGFLVMLTCFMCFIGIPFLRLKYWTKEISSSRIRYGVPYVEIFFSSKSSYSACCRWHVGLLFIETLRKSGVKYDGSSLGTHQMSLCIHIIPYHNLSFSFLHHVFCWVYKTLFAWCFIRFVINHYILLRMINHSFLILKIRSMFL